MLRSTFAILAVLALATPSLATPVASDVPVVAPLDALLPTGEYRGMWRIAWMWDEDGDRLDDRLESGPLEGLAAIVVDFDHRPTDADVAALETLGFIVDYRAKFVDSVTGAIDATRLGDVARLPGVARVEMQLTYYATNDVLTRTIKAEPSTTYADTVWDDLGLRGQGMTIAIIDTGVDDAVHQSFAGKYVCGFNAISGSVGNPDDDNEHGTHVAGTALGHGGTSAYPYGTNAGVAPEAKLVDIKVLSSSGSSSGSSVLEGIEWATDNKAACGIDVISLSLGALFDDDGTSADAMAINAASNAGLIATIAAGNHQTFLEDNIGSPGSADTAITIAASNDQNTVTRAGDPIASFSNHGPRISDGDADTQDERKPEVTAPGQNIVSAQYNTASGYSSLSGTSMATPAMAGVVALMLQANPDLDWRDVEDILIATSEDKGTAGWDNSWGYGYVDAFAAVSRALDLATPNTLPTACFTHTESELATSANGGCSTDPDGSIASWSWSWGDGSPASTGATASHTYASAGTYTVTLTVTDNRGGTDSDAQTVTVSQTPNQLPTACFTHAESGASTSVNGGCSTDPDGSIASWSWDWGDGSPDSTGSTASHAYATGGTYTVTLTVTDNRGGTDTETASVTVASPPNQAPTACFTHSESGLTTSANGGCSSDPDGSIASWSWSWGDGSPASSGATASHAYAASGTYTVTLTVTDNAGATAATQQSVTVTSDPDPGATTLTNGVAKSDTISGAGSEKFYKIQVPAGKSQLQVVLDGPGCGLVSCNPDLDLYVRKGARPTNTLYDCRPYESDSDETCTISNPAADWWYIRVLVYSGSASASYTIKATYS